MLLVLLMVPFNHTGGGSVNVTFVTPVVGPLGRWRERLSFGLVSKSSRSSRSTLLSKSSRLTLLGKLTPVDLTGSRLNLPPLTLLGVG